MSTTEQDKEFMALAIEEAAKARSELGKRSPRVGAVVVLNGKIIGRAFRGEQAPGDHAEFTVLQKKLMHGDAKGAIVYTTLEPCTQRGPGKTPCFKWLIDHGVARVVVGIMDPNAVVAGRGVERLRDAGIEVDLAVAEQARALKALDSEWIAQYDENRRPWRELPSMTRARERHAAVRRGNGVLVIGGSGGSNGPRALAECELFTEAWEWQAAPSLRAPRVGHTAVALDDGSILVVGGIDATSYLSSAELLVPLATKWSPVGSLAIARFGHTATRLFDGRVLVCGGYYYDAGAETAVFLASAEVFEPETGNWSRVADMSTPRDGHTATLLPDGKVLIVGGRFLIPGTDRHLSLQEVEIFDPKTEKFDKAPPMAGPRARHAAIGVAGGVLVAGGAYQTTEGGYKVLSTSEYLGADGSRVPLNDLARAREAPLLFDVEDAPPMIVAGRTNANVTIEVTERYDAADRAWVAAPPMMLPRVGATAVSLPTARGVLIAGGLVTDSTGANPKATASVELFQH